MFVLRQTDFVFHAFCSRMEAKRISGDREVQRRHMRDMRTSAPNSVFSASVQETIGGRNGMLGIFPSAGGRMKFYFGLSEWEHSRAKTAQTSTKTIPHSIRTITAAECSN